MPLSQSIIGLFIFLDYLKWPMLKTVLFLLVVFALTACTSENTEQPSTQEPPLAKPEEKPKEPQLIKKEHVLKPNGSVYDILIKAGHSPIEIAEIVRAAKSEYDLAKIQAGTKYTTEMTEDKVLQRLTFRISNTERLVLTQKPGFWQTKVKKIPTEIRLISYSGEVVDTLWESSEKAGMVPYLITALAEVFSWEIDFSREIRQGDRWAFTVEEILAEGKHIGWGDIIYAQYGNPQTETLHKAFYYKGKKVKGHFDEKGNSLHRMFLKSPLKFGRVTSRFSRRRFHPIRKVYRPHLGVDYGAPRGTPIRTIGDGRITQIGRRGGAGKMITIKHPGGYKTRYLHLHRYRKGMKRGKKVEQGEIIGYVGSTGLATGPHLHFEMFKNGQYRDPLKIKLPASSSVPKAELEDFRKHVLALEKNHGLKESKPL